MRLIPFLVSALPFTLSAQVMVTDPAVLYGPVVNPSNGHNYYLLEISSWTMAEEKAVSLGGHLVTINNQEEMDWIQNTFSNYDGVSRDLWIGLYDQNPFDNASDSLTRQSEFVWASGEPVTFTNWNTGEPSLTDNAEYFVNMWRVDGNEGYSGKWNDLPDYSLFNSHGLVEVSSPVPEPHEYALVAGGLLGLFAVIRRRILSQRSVANLNA